MKKRLIPILLTLTLIAVLAVALVACGFGGKKTEKTENSIVVEVKGDTLTLQNGEITIPKGSGITLQKSDFTVQVVFGDGSKKEVTDYTLDTTGFDTNVVGTYSAIFSYKGFTYHISIVVQGEPNEVLPSLPEADLLKATYSGETISVIDLIDENMTGTKLSDLIREEKVTVSYAEGWSTENVNAGDYIAVFDAKEGYEWNENGGVTMSVSRTWTIEKKEIPLPTITGETTFTYDGTEKCVTVDTHGYDDYWTFANGGNDTRKATNATFAPQEVQAIMAEEKRSNYCVVWMNEKTSDGAYSIGTITVMPMSIARPELLVEASDKVVDPETGNVTYYYDYTGETIDVETNMDDYGFFTVETGAIGNAGTYSVTFSFDSQNYNGDNYKWSGTDTRISQDGYVSLTVVVRKANYTIPAAYAESVWTLQGEYHEFTKFADALYTYGYLALSDATIDWLTESGVWLEDSYLDYNDDEELDYVAGETTLSYNFYRNDNYEPIAISVIVEVAKAKQTVNIEWYSVIEQWIGTTTHRLLQGEKVRYAEYNGTPVDQRGYVYRAIVEGNDYNTTSTYTYYYKATQQDDYAVVNSVVKPGFYKTVFTISSDDPSVMLVDGNGDEWEPLVAEWEMEKAPLKVYGNTSGTFGKYDYVNDIYYSFRTGTVKTFDFDNEHITISYHWYDGNSPKTLGSDNQVGSDYYIDMADYVEIADPMTYALYVWNNGTWDDAQEAVEVGRYKWVPTGVTLLAGLDDYFDLILPEYEFIVLSTTIDASAMQWVNAGSYTYGTGIPYVQNVPLGMYAEYKNVADPSYGPNTDVGSHSMQVVFGDTGVDGWNLVTITYPAGWNDQADYTITKKVISSADFALAIDGEAYDGNGIVYDGNNHFAGIINPFNNSYYDFGTVTVTDMSREWEPIGERYAGIGRSEVGTYTYTVWVTIGSTANDARYDFDLTDPNVEEVTSFTPDTNDPSIFIVPIYEGTEQIVVSVDYPYILKLTFSWSIVEGE